MKRAQSKKAAARAGAGPMNEGSDLMSATAYRGKILTALAPREGDEVGSPHLRYLEDGVLKVDAAGIITSVEPFDPAAHRGPVLDLRPRVLLPGLVDGHAHFPQTRVVGGASGPLLEWLTRTIFPEEARFTDRAYASAVAEELALRALSFGTTTCVLFSSSSATATDALFEVLARSGARAIAGTTLMDQRCPEDLAVPCDEAIAQSRDLIARWNGFDGGRLAFAVTPRFAPSCSRRLLEEAAKLSAEYGLHVQTHIAETVDETETALAAHPYAIDYLDVYEKAGLISRRTLLAHSIHLSPSEWDRIEERGACVVHCPDSNFFLGSGRMRLVEAELRGVPVALGSDVAAGRTFDMRRVIASAYDNALCAGHRVSPEALFAMATLGGAEALGLEGSIGSLEAGKEADFIAVNLPAYVVGRAEVMAYVAFASDVALVDRAFVRGRQVYRRDSSR